MNLGEAVATQDNSYDELVTAYEARTGQFWNNHASLDIPCPRPLSVVIPARNVAYAIGFVLDALQNTATSAHWEVIVVDDASSDTTNEIVRRHTLHPKVIVLPRRCGPSVARNVGTAVASGETILFLDADMVIPSFVLHEHAVRGSDTSILLGFRHNIRLDDVRFTQPGGILHSHPDLEADHRVNWYARPGQLLHSGITLEQPVGGKPLRDTDNLRDLGKGRFYYDWDLPRMVVTAMVSLPRSALLDVGGFDPAFADGWAVEDTHIGAKLIAQGLKVIPLPLTVGFHIDPPDAEEQWKAKLATWPRNIALYQQRLKEPVPSGLTKHFLEEAEHILQQSQVI